MVAPLLIAGGAMAGAGLLGGINAMGGSNGKEYLDRALAEWNTLKPPTAEEMKYQLEQMVQMGQITPEMAQSYLMEKTAYEDVPESNVGRDAELAALQQLTDISSAGGLTATDRAKIGQLQGELGTSQRGAREAISQNAAARGISGSGLELAAQLGSQQAATQAASQQGMDIAALAEQRALEAIKSQGALGGQLSSADTARAQKLAEARDAITRFNAANRQNVEMANVGARNTAQAANLGERQRMADSNVAMKNQKAAYDAQLAQQQFENQKAITAGRSGVLGAQSTAQAAKRQADMGFWGGILGSGGTMMAGGMRAPTATPAAGTEPVPYDPNDPRYKTRRVAADSYSA